MTREDLNSIQQKIGYSFKNQFLLQQAFLRRSYSQEHSEFQNNEILEFIGDSELNSYIVRKLAAEFGKIENSQFACRKNEGELTQLKSKYVSKQSLSHCIDVLGFSEYLIMGKSDIHNGAKNSDSVKEDLFEAIVGAVAVDSGFDKQKIGEVCESMLGYFDFSEDYVSLVADWCEENGWSEPNYSYSRTVDNLISFSCKISITNKSNFKSVQKYGEGKTAEIAKISAAESLYFEHCKIENMRIAVGEPLFERAISQLHELSQKGFFSEPEYFFEEEYEKNGKPLWKCSCRIGDFKEYCWNTDSTKKGAKKKAAYSELLYVLGIDEDYDDEDEYYEYEMYF